jgi:dihydroorotate dehydrogenase electron transfer subunit
VSADEAWIRAVAPRWAPIRSVGRVLSNVVDGHGRKLVLAVRGWPGSLPGQFVMVGAGAISSVDRRDPLLPRPMAVYRDLGAIEGCEADERAIELLYRVVGRGTTLLAETTSGERVSVVGPLGQGFPVETTSGAALLVGGGTGIASLYELARSLAAHGRAVTVMLGARSAADLTGRDDFAALARDGVELLCTTEDGSEGLPGLVTGPLAERLAQGAAVTVYAVGPTPMMRACAERAAAQGVPCLVSLENPMACGFGVCLGCAAPRAEGGFSLVCRAGPVFDAREIDWEGLP